MEELLTLEFVAASFPDDIQRHLITANFRTIQDALNILNNLGQQEVRSLAARPTIINKKGKQNQAHSHNYSNNERRISRNQDVR
jgi:hypothetical protein